VWFFAQTFSYEIGSIAWIFWVGMTTGMLTTALRTSKRNRQRKAEQ
jgi:hypothetical protein